MFGSKRYSEETLFKTGPNGEILVSLNGKPSESMGNGFPWLNPKSCEHGLFTRAKYGVKKMAKMCLEASNLGRQAS